MCGVLSQNGVLFSLKNGWCYLCYALMQDAVRAAHLRPAHTMFRGTQGTGPSWGPTRTPCVLTPGSGSSVVAAADADWPTGTARTHGPGQRALCQWVASNAPCVATAHAWGAFSPRDDTYICVSGPLPHTYPMVVEQHTPSWLSFYLQQTLTLRTAAAETHLSLAACHEPLHSRTIYNVPPGSPSRASTHPLAAHIASGSTTCICI